jgi:titin
MRPLVSDLHPDANQISLDWLQLSPHGSTCSFQSRAIDGGTHRSWVNLNPVVSTPAGTNVQFNTRTSNDAATWSAWSPVTGTQINSPVGRYVQYQAVLTTTDVALTPSLSLVRLASNGIPATPTGVAGVPGNGSMVVSWTAPANNGSPITAYVVTPYIGFIAQPARTFNSAATTQTVTGLTNGTAYIFKVAARNANGTGPASVSSSAVTVGAPVAPTGVTAVPGNGSAVVSWTAPADNGFSITAYVVTPYVGSTAQPARTFNSTATSQTVTSLTNGTAYTFTVAAKNAKGTGPPSAATAAVTAGAPVAPTNAVAVPGNGSAVLSWTAPANNGSAITGYVVTPYIGFVAQPVRTFNSTATTQTITGLTNGATYVFKVAATNARGTSPPSVSSRSITVGAPRAPTGVSATAGASSATVSWVAPANNGSTITAYVVTPYVGTVAQPARTFNSTATSQPITGLTPATTYTFTVAAKNANGTGPQSAASNAVTPT